MTKTKPVKETYDLCVIGGGSGGVRAARLAAMRGRKVILAEEYRLGGTCVIRGCIPKKLLVYASRFGDEFEDARHYGWKTGARAFSWNTLRRGKDKEVARLSALYEKGLRNAGVTIRRARARLVDSHIVRIGSTHIRAKKILLACGGRPFQPDLAGVQHTITSNEAFNLARLPRRIVIVGAGYIAVEFAGIFHGLGSQVTLVYRGDEILRGFDDGARRFIREAMEARGMRIVLGRNLARVTRTNKAARVAHLDNGRKLTADQVMLATGRVPNTEGLGLAQAGVRVRATSGINGAIVVNQFSQTSRPHIYALGDATDRAALTPVAIRDAMAFVETAYGKRKRRAHNGLVPTAVFSQPELGTLGLSEEEARKRFRALEIYESRFVALRGALLAKPQPMLMKMIVAKSSQKVVGLHIVGEAAAEMIQAFAVALQMGATKQDFDATLAVHPTAAEELVTMREVRP